MTDFLPDDIVCNIITRLPAKTLLRFQCVSKSWNRAIKEPHFMKLRLRKIIMIPLRDTFLFIDDTCNSIVERCFVKRSFPFDTRRIRLKMIGTLNGVVLLACDNLHILYNPLTGVCKDLPSPPHCPRSAYGFGYGANSDDLNLVRIREFNTIYDVYNFRESSWSTKSTSEYKIFTKVRREIGHFVNGSLYRNAYGRSVLIVLDLKDMLLSEMCLPFEITKEFLLSLLGTINGSCLCSLYPISLHGFDMWVMKEQDRWSKIYSFELQALNNDIMGYMPVCILNSGKILMLDPSRNLLIYDTSKDSFETFNALLEIRVGALEYVESLVSPSDICMCS